VYKVQNKMLQKNPSIAYKLEQIDPGLTTSRDEGSARLELFNLALRSQADVLDPDSEKSLGRLLGAKRSREESEEIISMLGDTPSKKPRICLLSSSTKLINVEEADKFDECDRRRCISVSGTNQVAIQTPETSEREGRLLITFPKEFLDGIVEAKIDASRNGTELILSTLSAAAVRKRQILTGVPSDLLDKLFEPKPVVARSILPSTGDRELPSYLKLAIVDFLERRVRLQVLCTAAMPNPVSRPVVIDHAYTRKVDGGKKNLLSISATLHPSSSSCICGAHGLRMAWPGRVEICLETCGRSLQPFNNYLRCPCHQSAIDSSGNSRFNIENICTECTNVSVACYHNHPKTLVGTVTKSKSGKNCTRGVCIENVKLTDVDREELATILVNTAEYNTRAAHLLNDRRTSSLNCLSRSMQQKFEKSMKCIKSVELFEHKELLRRDMVAVDLLRAGGVFRHIHKSGTEKGAFYLKRAKRSDSTVPLKPFESGIANTHGHIFRKAVYP